MSQLSIKCIVVREDYLQFPSFISTYNVKDIREIILLPHPFDDFNITRFYKELVNSKLSKIKSPKHEFYGINTHCSQCNTNRRI